MENLINSHWRSTDSNSDNLDESATETINSSFLSSNTQKDTEDIDSEDGLLNAMNNLQITVEESNQLNHLDATEKTNVNEENKLLEGKVDCTQTNTLEENTKMNNTLNLLEPFVKARTPMKSKLAVPTKPKTSSIPSPELSKSKIMNTSLNSTISKNKNPKETDKRIIKTLVDTDKGIEIREEKINHFSIPIIDSKKKRTEPIGFSFLSRIKKPIAKIHNNVEQKSVKTGIQQTNKNISLNNQRKTVIRSQSALTINRNQNTTKRNEPLKTKLPSESIKRSTTTSSLSATKNTKNVKVHVHVPTTKKISQENKPPNENEVNKPKMQNQLGKAVPPKLHTNQRAKQRHEFDVKLKQKEMEIEKIRLELEKKQREKEKLEELALRKTMEHKANPVPEFKVPAPIRSKKPLTEPQSPAWALKAKQAK